MTLCKPFLAEISNINIFHITQYFWVKSYKHNQWNLPNILAYVSAIFNDFFKAGLVPLRNRDSYFLNEETEGDLTDTVIYFYDQHLTWLSHLKPNAKVG